ncbi:PQQ-binding-like beta-propeller repeat protein [bacterium]|nr:PQQ-binding-like beta-propeller repeat protein [Planctomycetaceae bacterium]MDB4793109.1 PQQ-binding-like beta-propeller repeat protein [bacterium]
MIRYTSFVILFFFGMLAEGADWARFRGPNGAGAVSSSDEIPTQWSSDANLAWKTPLPGPGASSPIIVNGKVFVTCYSGYGLARDNPGEIENLVRHLVCIDMKTGEKLWQKNVEVSLPEDPYTGIGVTAHGYASHTPVSDGKKIYAFFGKSGVHAYDLTGKELWQADVGKESDPARWGSASSPIVYENTVIVTASAESQAIVGLDRETGEELWRQEAKGLDGMWGTPVLVEVDENRTDLVMCVAKELWGLDPSNGKLRWFANATGAQQAYSSVVMDGTRVFAFTGRGGGSIALDVKGSGDVSDSNTVWVGGETASFASPVRFQSRLFVVARGILTVVDSKTGKRLQQIRLRGVESSEGRFGSLDYPSPIVIGDRLFYSTGGGQMFVFSLGDEVKQIAVNKVTDEQEKFWGTPAVSNGRMVLRSSHHLYCVANKGESVANADRNLASSTTEKPDAPPASRSGGGPGRSGGRNFDPMSMFNGLDANKDGEVTENELEGNRMADRLRTLDKDDDKVISAEEFRTGISTLFSRGTGGRGNYSNRGSDSRPNRPQRPESSMKP